MEKDAPSGFRKDEQMTLKRFKEFEITLYNAQAKSLF